MELPLTDRLAGDLDGSFELAVHEHQDRLYTLAYRYLGHAHDAEDVTQDAFVRAYRALRGYDPARIRQLDLRAWLTTILLNLVRNRARGATARAHAGPVAGANVPSRPDEQPDRVAERRDEGRRLGHLVATLPPRYRAAVLLRHVDGCSYAEMAAILDRPEGTLKAQVHRGTELLRAAYEADERGRPVGPAGGGARPADRPGMTAGGPPAISPEARSPALEMP